MFPSSEAETNIVTARQHAVVLDVLVGLRRAAQARTSIHLHFIAGVVLLWGRLVAERSALDEALVGDTERVGGSDRPATAGFSMMVMPERMMYVSLLAVRGKCLALVAVMLVYEVSSSWWMIVASTPSVQLAALVSLAGQSGARRGSRTAP